MCNDTCFPNMANTENGLKHIHLFVLPTTAHKQATAFFLVSLYAGFPETSAAVQYSAHYAIYYNTVLI